MTNPMMVVGFFLTCAGALVSYWLMGHPSSLQYLGRAGLVLAPFPLALVLTLRFPAEPTQPGVAAYLQDAGYLVLTVLVRMGYTSVFLATVLTWYNSEFPTLSWSPGNAWPVFAKLFLAIVVTDLLAWFHHWVRHRISFFWALHKLHHSQTRMNFFTDFRLHPLDFVVANFIILVPVLLLQVSLEQAILLGVIVQWHTIFVHLNLRTNYGPLGRLLVSPQYHRLHHSSTQTHHHCNFAVIFPIWDQLFGTRHEEVDVYPETGVEFSYPVERDVTDVLSLKAFFRQMWFPFLSPKTIQTSVHSSGTTHDSNHSA